MLTGIITHDNMVVLSDDGYPIIWTKIKKE